MKILILQDDFPPYDKGGAATIARLLADSYVSFGREVIVITAVQSKENVGIEVLENGIIVHRIFSKYHGRWRAWRCLYNFQTVKIVESLIKKYKPDIVHAHNVHEHISYATLRTAKKNGSKVVLTAHDTQIFMYGKLTEFSPKSISGLEQGFRYKVSWIAEFKKVRWRYNPFRNIVIRKYLRSVDKIVAVSGALKSVLEQNDIKEVVVIHNGIDSTIWEVSKIKVCAFAEKIGAVDRKVILLGGRLNGPKGLTQALLAMSEVAKSVPEAVLLVLGKKMEYADPFILKAKVLHLEDKILSTGWVSGEELHTAFALADVVLVPSLYPDPLPTLVLEAMASKKPVVGTCFGGTPEMIENEVTGYVVNPFDEIAMADKIVKILRQEGACAEMGDRGYSRILDSFSLKSQTQAYLELFEKI